jgi:hypothetical protein
LGQILQRLRDSDQKGKLLEAVMERVLHDQGFLNVRRQLSGTQFGFDVIATAKSREDGMEELWKFECKNLKGPTTVTDIAPKLIWNLGPNVIDRFVIVSTSELSNDLHHLLTTHTFAMPIEAWTGEYLERLIQTSPSAMELLGLTSQTGGPSEELEFRPVSYPPQALAFDVFHELDPPFCFDYFCQGDEVTKAYTDGEFRLRAVLTNNSNGPVDVHSLDVVTLDFKATAGRILRLAKMKGMYTPYELRFSPSKIIGGSSNILGKSAWRVSRSDQEMIRLMLNDEIEAGLYDIMFRASCYAGTGITNLFSSRFPLRVYDSSDDLLTLYVFRHYDSAANHILR